MSCECLFKNLNVSKHVCFIIIACYENHILAKIFVIEKEKAKRERERENETVMYKTCDNVNRNVNIPDNTTFKIGI